METAVSRGRVADKRDHRSRDWHEPAQQIRDRRLGYCSGVINFAKRR
jgi:hypothetical protein